MVAYFARFKDAKGEWRWRFVAANGKIIAVSSESYVNKVDCDHGIALIKKEGQEAVVIDA